MVRLRDSRPTSLPVAQQPRNPQPESIARKPYHASRAPNAPSWINQADLKLSSSGGQNLPAAPGACSVRRAQYSANSKEVIMIHSRFSGVAKTLALSVTMALIAGGAAE